MPDVRNLKPVKNIALVAHDNKKGDLINWAENNKNKLEKHKLLATGTTGRMIEEQLNLPVKKLFSGPIGGDQQVGAMIAEGNIDMIVFFWDPMEAQPHDSDVKALLRLAVAWNIIIACNRTTADFVLTSNLMDNDYSLSVPDFSNHLKRNIGAK
jgi:methylglyoxal synthase